jgi:hypothetical protein
MTTCRKVPMREVSKSPHARSVEKSPCGQATLTVFLRNGLSFTFTPTQAGLPAPSETAVAELMAEERAIEPVALAQPRIVIRWSEVVAVRIDQPKSRQPKKAAPPPAGARSAQ